MEQYPLVKLDGETIINLNHIVDVDYTPEHDYDDDYGKTRHAAAKLEITTTAIEIDNLQVSDGRVLGVASKSQVIHFHGDKAARLWTWLSDNSYVIV